MNFKIYRYYCSFCLVKLVLCLLCILNLSNCGGGGGSSPSSSNSTNASNNTGNSNSTIVSLSASPAQLNLGQSTQLTWSSANSTSCQTSWGNSVGTSGTQTISPSNTGTVTYTLTCNGVSTSSSVSVSPVSIGAPAVSLSLSSVSIKASQTSTLSWAASNASSCMATGAWTGSQALSGNISINQSQTGHYNYGLQCSNASGVANGSIILSVAASNNVAQVIVDAGPEGVNNQINAPFTNVTICYPNSSTCQTIDHVLVDTGSYGLRILSSVINSNLNLPTIYAPNGDPAAECAQFFSGILWGSVKNADIKIASESAASIPIQVVADTSSPFTQIPSSCQNTGSNMGTLALLGAKGILGIGLFTQDCGSTCVNSAVSGSYYSCPSSGTCTSSSMPLNNQVSNPVSGFSMNNNGVLLKLPAVATGGVTTLSGLLIFGIDTQANNQIGSANIIPANSLGNFTTSYKGKSLTSSFFDSGSNGLFFSDSTISYCSDRTGFYCPASTLTLSAIQNASNNTQLSVNFSIENLTNLDSNIIASNIGGSIGRYSSGIFDWGLPFFFGRSVFIAISGATTQHGTGPFWAY